MKNLWLTIFGMAVLTAAPAPAALVCYELRLTTDNAFAPFGGGSAGTEFTGLFGFDDGLLAVSGPVFQPDLDANDFFFVFDMGNSTFSSSVAGTLMSSGLYFDGGEVLDVFFDFTNPNGDQLEVSTIVGVESKWSATQAGNAAQASGATLLISVQFVTVAPHALPEPAAPTLGALAALILGSRRRRR